MSDDEAAAAVQAGGRPAGPADADPREAPPAAAAAQNLAERLMSSGHERAEGDVCSICYLYVGLPVHNHSKLNACCLKRLCNGCILAARQRGMLNRCPFAKGHPPLAASRNERRCAEQAQSWLR
ncbi:hypothetical protein THAOC_00576 [Thalassiosira oceanica]|uniref:RING-type domain-containing protein n=1 Tax=Thalassiosira oceanica TaxID=159749 RepID=K0TFR6_THAOC|nr:hypothetical protein THAOC_00576 [Thalassiosira oceanica]|eukprot:EJK77583.1 hypothetical protein THAOC_00576 [Thalassiosira oceanica]